ncbi:uncharacterized protein [Dermacentor albipictus]|uniref:uncharacterized protein n=1 Tax=Dermacentor albipictus TaxID=60249 RepID=UPI0038FC9DB1
MALCKAGYLREVSRVLSAVYIIESGVTSVGSSTMADSTSRTSKGCSGGLVTWRPAVIEHCHVDAHPMGQLVGSSIGLVNWGPHYRFGRPLFWRPGDCPCCGPGGQLL